MREKVKKPWNFSLGCIWMVWYGYGRDIKNSCLANVNAMTEEVAEILDLSVEAVNVHKRNGVQCIKN